LEGIKTIFVASRKWLVMLIDWQSMYCFHASKSTYGFPYYTFEAPKYNMGFHVTFLEAESMIEIDI